MIAIEPKESDIGDGFIVRRSLPTREKRSVGPFVFWDHMGPVQLGQDKEMKVRAHPHIGLATITYLFSGEIMHRDSLGNKQPIRPGEVNWMTAGKGIVHSERVQVDKPMTVEGIQLWVALPKEQEEVEPSFVHLKADQLPVIDHNNSQLILIAGKSLDEESPVPVFSDLFYLYGKSESFFTFDVEEHQEAAIYVTGGEVSVDGVVYYQGTLLVFDQGEDIEFSSNKAEFMLFGGTPLPEKRYMWWNFVSHSQERIERAKKEWQEGQFPAVIDETEVIPLPDK